MSTCVIQGSCESSWESSAIGPGVIWAPSMTWHGRPTGIRCLGDGGAFADPRRALDDEDRRGEDFAGLLAHHHLLGIGPCRQRLSQPAQGGTVEFILWVAEYQRAAIVVPKDYGLTVVALA